MDSIVVAGGNPLAGTIPIAGAKNACLALMPAALLTDSPVRLTNTPRLLDILTMTTLLRTLGVMVTPSRKGTMLDIHAAPTTSPNLKADYDIVRKMRASILVLGPLLARYGAAEVSLPGGCAIGARPVDLHLTAFEAMGARIEGAGSRTLVIEGVDHLKGTTHPVIVDRIEMGTYMLAPAIAGGTVTFAGGRRDLLETFCQRLEATGVGITQCPTGLTVSHTGERVRPVDVHTAPFPGFPTDLQAQILALLCTADGVSVLTERIFENRFMHTLELARMGARITVAGGSATVTGVERLRGAPVMATDLRASISLILAGLAAEGETRVSRVYHLDRGYEHVVRKLSAVGATIERLKEGERRTHPVVSLRAEGHERIKSALSVAGAEIERGRG